LPDVYVTCEACNGRRYNEATLHVRYREKSIADVLEMTVDEARALFANYPKIERILAMLVEVGLAYVTLGQPATTLSGGEAQRIKLARELARIDTGSALYLLDEPTTGLHFDDIRKLLSVLHRLVDHGNTVLVIEHNLEVIASSDWLIDLGPEGGNAGGRIVAEGTPEHVAKSKNSFTADALSYYFLSTSRDRRPNRS
jgi:excinuclease ABC subunit A